MEHILVVEDNKSLREVLGRVLSSEGYSVALACSAEEALEHIGKEGFSLVLCDLKLPNMNGLEFLSKCKSLDPSIPVVIMTAYGNIDIAVSALKRGASDFITKPFDPEDLCSLISQIAAHRRIVDRSFSEHRLSNKRILTKNTRMLELLDQVERVAPLKTPVMIVGESGSGKELLARHIHSKSPRADNPFVAVNCASVPGDLLESEFFGHEAGAFTGATEKRIGLFEIANSGSIFLDEVGNMPSQMQVKLLRAIQESEIRPVGGTSTKKIDSRIISAMNCDVESALASGKLREDLYYRIAVLVLEIPPLRERPEDIPFLANYFAESFSKSESPPEPFFTDDAMKALSSYHWPGNIRELENSIERAMVFSNLPIGRHDLSLGQSSFSSLGCSQGTLPEISAAAVREAETVAICRALREHDGNKSKAAQVLGVSYKTLLTKIKAYGIDSTKNTERSATTSRKHSDTASTNA